MGTVRLHRIGVDDALAQAQPFDAVIDARSPAEHALDHLPGALNWPVLDDEERRVVGTEYTQLSAFDARKRGAVMAARADVRHQHHAHVLLPNQTLDEGGHTVDQALSRWQGGQRRPQCIG